MTGGPSKERAPGTFLYQQAEDVITRLLAILQKHGIAVEASSVLESMVLNLYNVAYGQAGELGADRKADIRQHFVDFIGLSELAAQLARVADHASFSSLVEHLKLLNCKQPLQNKPSLAIDQASRKLFELLVATWAMRCGSDVRLDDPDHAKGDNPDVLVTVRGRRWGFACKVLQRFHREGFLDHLRKGIAQIEASEAEVGVVIFNFRNIIDHSRYWRIVNEEEWTAGAEPLFSCFEQPRMPFELLRQELQQSVGVVLQQYVGDAPLIDIFDGKKSIPAYLLWGHTTSAVMLNGAPTPAAVRVLNLQYIAKPEEWQLHALECINGAATTLK